jgi:hypothetical protein
MPPLVNKFNVSKKNAAGKEDYINMSSAMVKYYNTVIMKSKAAVNAVAFYKGSGYVQINNFLTWKLQPTLLIKQPQPDNSKSSDNALDKELEQHKATKDAYKKVAIAPLIKYIKELDRIIANAPNIIQQPLHVYRGMSFDIMSEAQCEDGKMVYTFPNYVSTSFTPSVSRNFANGGCMYTLILQKGVKGIYLSFEVTQSLKNFQNVHIDIEAELLLPRRTKFEIVGLEFIHMPPQYFRFKDVPCLEKQLNYVKHYTLKFVSHAPEQEMKESIVRATDALDYTTSVFSI